MPRSIQWFLFLSQFFIILALEMTNPFLSLLIANQNEVVPQNAVFYSMLGLVLPMLAQILMAPIWGRAADYYGYKPMLMRAAWALVFTQLAMMFVHSLIWILIIRILQGAFAGFIVSMQTYSLSLCEWHNKSRQLARLQSAKAIATTIAGFIGGVVLSLTNYRGLYGISMFICFFISLTMQCLLPSVQGNMKSKSEKTLPVSASPVYFFCFLITFTQIIKFLPDPGFTLFVQDSLSENLVLIGLFYSFPAVGMLLSSELCGRQFDKIRSNSGLVQRYLVRYSLLGFILMLGQAMTMNLYLFACLRILWGIVLAALLPALYALLSDRYSLPGYALGLAHSFAKLGNLLGLVLGGLLINFLPFNGLFLIIAFFYVLFAGISWKFYWLFVPPKQQQISTLHFSKI